MLLKFCYKALHQTETPWKTWITNLSPFPISQGHNSSFLGKTVFKILDLLRAITKCIVNNGMSTFFWLDPWLLPEPLAYTHSALFSHHINPTAFVGDIVRVGIQSGLWNRLTSATSAELDSLVQII
jgi:hypothetical protein